MRITRGRALAFWALYLIDAGLASWATGLRRTVFRTDACVCWLDGTV